MIDSAFYFGGVVLPGPSAAPSSNGAFPSWNTNGTFAGWIGSYDGSTLTLPNTIVNQRLVVGANGTMDGKSLLYPSNNYHETLIIQESYTDFASGSQVGTWAQVEANPSANSNIGTYAFICSTYSKTGNDKNMGRVYGSWSEMIHQGTGTITSGYAAYNYSQGGPTAPITSNYGEYTQAFGGTNVYGHYISAIRRSVWGTVEAGSCYGMRLDVVNQLAISSGTDFNYGILSQVTRTGATGGTIATYNYYSDMVVDNAGAGSHFSYDFYATARTGSSDADYFLWFNSTGVYRIKADGVMAYYNPAFTQYTPNATNYERVVQQWSSNVLQYGLEAGGTGTLRNLQFIGALVDVNCKITSKGSYQPLTADTDGSTITFDMSASNFHKVTLGGNRTLAVSSVTTGQAFSIRLTQDGTGSRTVTWWSGISWAGGSAPTLTTTAGKTDTLGFLCTGSGTYDGFVMGQNI